jgi:hypothetical protein
MLTRRLSALALGTAVVTTTALFPSAQAWSDPCNGNGPKFGCGAHENGGGGGGGDHDGGGGGGGNGELPDIPGAPQGGAGGDPAVDGGGGPTAADLAQQARAGAVLPVPVVHTAPTPHTYVRLKTALWVGGFEEITTPPATTATMSVIAVATPKTVTWHLGPKNITCENAGAKNDPDLCGYTYQRSSANQAGGVFKITARITWSLRWVCTGAGCPDPAAGDLPDLFMDSAPFPLIVTEIQTESGTE